MKKFILLTLSVFNFAFACPFQLQDDNFACEINKEYKELSQRLANLDINIETLTKYRATRFINNGFWDSKKDEINFLPWLAYTPATRTWLFWERGEHFLQTNAMNATPLVIIDDFNIELLREWHRNSLHSSIIRDVSKRKGTKPGKIRTGRHKEPAWHAKCDSWPLSEKDYFTLKNFDYKANDGVPYVTLSKVKKCRDKQGFYSARIEYLKTEYVMDELEKFIQDTKTQWLKFFTEENLNQSPIAFIADTQRRFVSIHPFGDANGRMSRFIQDLLAKSFDLPFPNTGLLGSDLTTPKAQYRDMLISNLQRQITELRVCVEKLEANPALTNDDCAPLYQDPNDKFTNALALFIDVPLKKKSLKKFFKKHRYLDVDDTPEGK